MARICELEGCGRLLTGKQRSYCSSSHRGIATRRRKAQGEAPAAPTEVVKVPLEPSEDDPRLWGRIRRAAEATLKAMRREERLAEIDSARVEVYRALADRLDTVDRSAVGAQMGEAPLWKEFRAVEDQLREAHDAPDAFDKLLESLRT